MKTWLADRVTWIRARGLKGIILDASAITDPEEPVLYYAASWVQNVAGDAWGM